MQNATMLQSYDAFMAEAHSLLHITNNSDYETALETIEWLLETADDTLDSPMNPLIDMVSRAIERYEMQDADIAAFVETADNLPADVAILKTLMDQHNLTGSDFPEIGDKTLVSRILNQKDNRRLTRGAIEALSKRFNLPPALFFDAV